jgi:hypothetical protein
MDMKEEMMSDAIDDAMGEEGDEEERWVKLRSSANNCWPTVYFNVNNRSNKNNN